MADHPGRVLVVDGMRSSQLKLSTDLRKEGYEVTLADGGPQALEILKGQQQDAVLLNMALPGMDGFGVLRQIKGDPDLRDTPVIVLCAEDAHECAARCIQHGADDYLPEAYDPLLLRVRMAACMRLRRLRALEKLQQQQEVMLRQSEKLVTLGKLSAGLAHEMNNPAAAVQRSAVHLGSIFSRYQTASLGLLDIGLTAEQFRALPALHQKMQERQKSSPRLKTLDRMDADSRLEAWLDAHGVENVWEMAPVFSEAQADHVLLTALLQPFSEAQWPAVLDWLSWDMQITSLAADITLGAGRIMEIVNALKSYAYMDPARLQPVDLHEGLDNTLVMLRSKLAQGVVLAREYAPDLPLVQGYGSELNQLWTNLIDNAIDAVNGQGRITLRTRCEEGWAVVEVEDSGPGIAETVRGTVFDPFTTTKPPGKGTGLGLHISQDIVQKHHGKILVDSQPGKTRFAVWLPLGEQQNERSVGEKDTPHVG